MATIRLLLDEDVRPLLGNVLRTRGYDVVAVVAVGLSGTTDRKLLEWATKEERAILTHNTADFVMLHQDYVRRGWEHGGIIVSDRVPFKELLTRTLHLMSRKTAEEMRTGLEWLQVHA